MSFLLTTVSFGVRCLEALDREKALWRPSARNCSLASTSLGLLGQLVFEYGTLLHAVANWSALSVLDIGPGASDLPFFLRPRALK